MGLDACDQTISFSFDFDFDFDFDSRRSLDHPVIVGPDARRRALQEPGQPGMHAGYGGKGARAGRTIELLQYTIDGSRAAAAGHADVELVGVRINGRGRGRGRRCNIGHFVWDCNMSVFLGR